MCPSVNKEELTDAEDQLIMELVQQMGTKWAKIAQMLPGRAGNTIKNHWNSRMRHSLRQQLEDDDSDSPPPTPARAGVVARDSPDGLTCRMMQR